MNNIKQYIHKRRILWTLPNLRCLTPSPVPAVLPKAAQKVHRVPSNLTTRIRQLEADLGVELFIRENQRLRLSPAGHSFYATASKSALVDEARMVVAGDEPQGLFSSARWKVPLRCASPPR